MSHENANDIVYSQPYAWEIKFEGRIVVPIANEKQAIMEICKALQEMSKPYKLYDDYRDPEFTVWSGASYDVIVDKNGNEV